MDKDILALMAIVVAIVAILFYGVYWMESKTCMAKWKDMNPSYSLFTECMIDTKEGRVPASSYRVF